MRRGRMPPIYVHDYLLKSGTALLNSFEIEEKIDSFGSTVKCTAGYNTITVSVY